MRGNPRTCDHAPNSPVRKAQEQFNNSYCAILRLLDQAFNGSPQTLRTAIGSMYHLKVQAQALMEIPTEDGTTTAGPTFECVPPQSSSSTTAARSIDQDYVLSSEDRTGNFPA
jgi:hypothetical protein